MTKLPQIALSVLAILALFTGWLVSHDAKVVTKERARVQAKGAKTHAKAQAARAAVAATPGSADRLRSKYCRDCGDR